MSGLDELLGRLVLREGGFVNDPVDPGGATKFGITLKTLAQWRGKAVTVEDVRNLGLEEAKDIYRTVYYEREQLGELPGGPVAGGVQEHIFDMLCNGGADTAWRILQTAVNMVLGSDVLQVDGKNGPLTQQMVGRAWAVDKVLFARLVPELRKAFYLTLCEEKPPLRRFLKGWLNRVDEMRG